MAFKLLHEGRLVGVRWLGRPEEGDVQPLLDAVGAAHRAHGPLMLIIVIPTEADPPDEKARKKMRARWDDLFGCAEHAVGVLEGSGVRASLNRSVARMMMMFSRHRDKMVMVATVDEALAKVAPSLGRPKAELRARLQAAGIAA